LKVTTKKGFNFLRFLHLHSSLFKHVLPWLALEPTFDTCNNTSLLSVSKINSTDVEKEIFDGAEQEQNHLKLLRTDISEKDNEPASYLATNDESTKSTNFYLLFPSGDTRKINQSSTKRNH